MKGFVWSPAVDRYRPVLSELLLGFMHLPDEVYETLSGFWHPLFRPVGELELPHGPGLSVLQARPHRDKEINVKSVYVNHPPSEPPPGSLFQTQSLLSRHEMVPGSVNL